MKVGIIGCGWAFDLYMATWPRRRLEIAGVADRDPARRGAAGRYYGLRRYESNEALLADPDVGIVVNLTPPPSHYPVTKAALQAGKHVYSEKPLATDLAHARELVALAEANGLRLSCAPSNVLGDSARAMRKAVAEGAVGDVRLAYAELDTGPILLMRPESWRSKTGAPFPWIHELEMGCALEHAGYYLSLMCAMFGPVKSVAAFSRRTIPDEAPRADDFSVACLDFHCGVAGRLTCSIAAPHDHRFRVVGSEGTVWTDTYRHYRSPVYLERFTRLPLKGRLMAAVRRHTVLQRVFGVGGRRIPLARPAPPSPREPRWSVRAWRDRFWRHQEGQQDKCLGVVELADAVANGRRPFPPHDFVLHVTELTLAIRNAGAPGRIYTPESRFDPAGLPECAREHAPDWRAAARPPLLERLLWRRASLPPPRRRRHRRAP